MGHKSSSAIPHKLYLQDSAQRMDRLYRQLVPFGICCSIIQTGDKPKGIKKLDPRAVPGIVVGYGPCSKQYRVMALHQNMPFKVYTDRHLIVNASHFKEYFTRTATVPELAPFRRVHWFSVLRPRSVPRTHDTGPTSNVNMPIIPVCAMSLPTQAQSRGSEHAEHAGPSTSNGSLDATGRRKHDRSRSPVPRKFPRRLWSRWNPRLNMSVSMTMQNWEDFALPISERWKISRFASQMEILKYI